MTSLLLAFHVLLIVGFSARVLVRDDLSSDVRMAWIMVLILLPYVGCLLYFLLGEANIGRTVLGRHQRVRELVHERQADDAAAARVMGAPGNISQLVPARWQGVFSYAASINGFYPVAGNRSELMADGAAARARMLADFDAAQHQINVLYYIWLDDHTGTDMAQALMRAARRGVVCRAMIDGLGSRAFAKTALWQQMRDAGVHVAVALPVDHPIKVMLTSRIDLRNHRKITLIDGRITYVGSQNCAGEAFAVKARFAPWVDIMMRLQGPLVTQMQLLFATDWMQVTDESLDAFAVPAEPLDGGFVAQVVGEGPTVRRRATPQLVSTLIANARTSVTISTPYFVPDATVLEALCAAAWRGVQVRMVFPQRNDSWIVASASRSHYPRLLAAGVQIHEYQGGLLHAKTLTVDGEVTFMGSTNLDLRSFDLNFENNVLLHDSAATAAVLQRQHAYIAQAVPVTPAQVQAWPWWRRMWNNTLAALGPVL
ncbi:cardiolipin synthase [Ottowia sp.]|uniref:cardiolipin synthase n=1 Tax=Ottowia sp. TaxID=1898956 RepID=UPI003A8998EA